MITKLLEEIEKGKDWEETIFNMGCEIATGIANTAFEMLDDQIFKQRNTKEFRYIDSRKKTLITKFGSIRLDRKYYRNEKTKTYHFLLDEKLEIKKHIGTSSKIIGIATMMATIMSFRDVVFSLNKLLPASSKISHQTVHNMLQKEGEKYDVAQKTQTKALFENGLLPNETTQKEVDKIFLEADGTWIHLQREKKKDAEVKLGIAYEKLKQIGKDKFATVNKTIIAGLYTSDEFWQNFSTKLNYKYKVNKIKDFFLGGDGASWIKSGVDFLRKPKFYLDKFHIVKAIQRAFSFDGKKVGKALEAIEMNNLDEVNLQLNKEKETNPKKAELIERTIKYLTNNKDNLNKGKDVLGLGTIEGNIDKILANRLKKKGMSWRLSGAHNMAKMIEIRLTNPKEVILANYVPILDSSFKKAITETKKHVKKDPGSWLNATIPALAGPHANRPWAQVLKEINYI